MIFRPYAGEERVIRKFAFLPVVAGNEIRWLCFVDIHQSYDTKRHHKWTNDWFE